MNSILLDIPSVIHNTTQRYSNLVDKGDEDKELSSDRFLLQTMRFNTAPMSEPWNLVKGLRNSKADGSKVMDFKKGTTTLAFVFDGGIIVAADSRASMGSFVGSQTVRKVIEINDFLLGTMAGCAADCMFWERHLGRLCRLFELRNGQRISVAAASNLLSNIFFHYRGYGLSCGTMVTGWDHSGAQLFFVQDDGSKIKGDRFCVGSGSTHAYGIIDSGYRRDMSVEEAIELGRRAIYHATHRDAASGGLLRLYHIHSAGWTKVIEGEDVSSLHYMYESQKNEQYMMD